MSAISADGLRVELRADGSEIVSDVSLSIEPGNILGVVGESGSGKTTVGLTMLGHARRGTRIAAGSVVVDGIDVLSLARSELQALRGRTVAYVPQDPAMALNPAHRVGDQLAECVDLDGYQGSERESRIADLLSEVRLATEPHFQRRFPHEISGGQKQRVCIAMAFARRPRLVVCDEPTTGLDLTTQAHILETIGELCRHHDTAGMYVTHDLSVVRGLADEVLVLYAGRVAESGRAADVLGRPAHPYTRALIAAIPDLHRRRHMAVIEGKVPSPGNRPSGCVFRKRCEFAVSRCGEAVPPPIRVATGSVAHCFRAVELPAPAVSESTSITISENGVERATVLTVEDLVASFAGGHPVLDGVSFQVREREVLGIVGESGSGKTTLARCIIGLHAPDAGRLTLRGEPLDARVEARPRSVHEALQYVFQNPYASLNPRKPAGAQVAMPLRAAGRPMSETKAAVARALEMVGLPSGTTAAYPSELSGGERQRVALARALVLEPELLVCDEITSSLDVSVQAMILELLEGLRRDLSLTLIFITHDLAVVRQVASRVVVLSEGLIVEAGATDAVLDAPQNAYTRALVSSSPEKGPPKVARRWAHRGGGVRGR